MLYLSAFVSPDTHICNEREREREGIEAGELSEQVSASKKVSSGGWKPLLEKRKIITGKVETCGNLQENVYPRILVELTCAQA